MINKGSNEKQSKPDETATVDVSAHLVIKDKQTGKTIVNKRG